MGHCSDNFLERYIEFAAELDDEDDLMWLEHLSVCRVCEERRDQLLEKRIVEFKFGRRCPAREWIFFLGDDNWEHLPPQLRQGNALRKMQSHLSSCEVCNAYFREVRNFHKENYQTEEEKQKELKKVMDEAKKRGLI